MRPIPSQQPQRLKRVIAAFADHDVVVELDAEFFSGFAEFAGHVDVGLAGGGVTGRVVVD